MLTANRKETERALRALKAGVGNRPGIPALAGALVEHNGNGCVTLTATDLETTVRTSVNVHPAAVAGNIPRMLIPYRQLVDAVKAGRSETVEISGTDDAAMIDGGISVRLLPAEDFPVTDVPAGFAGEIDAAAFVGAADAVGKAVSGDYARPVLTGVLVEMSGTGVRFVATDSYRLHVVDADGRGELRAIVPGRAIAAVAKLIGRKATGTVSVAAGEFHVRFALPDGTLLSVRMIEAEFPNYSALIPTRGAGTAFRFDLAEAEAAIAGALSVLGKNGTQPVRLEIEPPSRIIRMTASSPDLGSWSGTLSQTAVWGENPVTVAFNPHYLLDTLRAAGDGATCEIRDGLKPLAAYSTDGKRTALLMPVRLPVSVS